MTHGDKIRVAVVIPRYFPIFGGSERQCRLLSQALLATGRVDIPFLLTHRITPDLERRARIDGIDCFRLGSSGLQRWREHLFALYVGLFLLRHARRFDLIHCHATALLGFVVTLVGYLLKKPVILKLSTNGELRAGIPEPAIGRTLLHRVWARIKHIQIGFTVRNACLVALNGEGLDELRELHARAALVIPNGVDTAYFHPAENTRRQALRAELGYKREDVVLVFSGRFVQRKGIDVLLEGFNRYCRQHPETTARLCLVGSGELQSDAFNPLVVDKAAVSAASISVFQPTDDVLKYLQAGDAFIFPSRNEGLPNAVLEALAVGLPCVLSDISPHQELAVDHAGRPIWLSACGQPQALADTIAQCVEFLKKGRTLASDGLNPRYRIKRVAECYLELYAEILPATRKD